MKLVSIPANPAPDGAVLSMLKTPDGVSLRTVRWPPPPGRKGTVCLFQGRAEFIEKYFETVRDLHARGFAVATLDWRGQGLSDRALSDSRKGYVQDYSQFDTDLSTFMKEIVLPDCPPPFFALAHSMGSAMLMRAAARNERWFDRMVFTAPLIRIAKAPFGRFAPAIARVLRLSGFGSMYVPGGRATVPGALPFVGNILTTDPVRYARTVAIIDAEPALGIGAPTVAWADATFKAMAEFAEPGFAGRVRQPILIVAAGRDKVVSTPAIEEFSTHLRAGTHLIIAGAQHEIMMEQDHFRQQFWAAFDAFVPGTPLFG
ncbi:MAG: alpha/beta fold hydrolase [Xanthobacteraceae bacterium]